MDPCDDLTPSLCDTPPAVVPPLGAPPCPPELERVLSAWCSKTTGQPVVLFYSWSCPPGSGPTVFGPFDAVTGAAVAGPVGPCGEKDWDYELICAVDATSGEVVERCVLVFGWDDSTSTIKTQLVSLSALTGFTGDPFSLPAFVLPAGTVLGDCEPSRPQTFGPEFQHGCGPVGCVESEVFKTRSAAGVWTVERLRLDGAPFDPVAAAAITWSGGPCPAPRVVDESVCVHTSDPISPLWNVVRRTVWGACDVPPTVTFWAGLVDVSSQVVSVVGEGCCPVECVDFGSPVCVVIDGSRWNVNRSFNDDGSAVFWDMDVNPPVDVTSQVSAFVKDGSCC